jgi:phosphoribosyl-ATP pyrophosphohydrolase
MTTLGQELDALAQTIAARAAAGEDASSYTAKLIAEGVEKCAKKFGEEAVETALAAVTGDKAHLAAEAADALYHLLVLLRAGGVEPGAVAAELQRRAGTSGLAEKAARRPE